MRIKGGGRKDKRGERRETDKSGDGDWEEGARGVSSTLVPRYASDMAADVGCFRPPVQKGLIMKAVCAGGPEMRGLSKYPPAVRWQLRRKVRRQTASK